VLCGSEQQKTEARTNHVFPFSTRRPRISVPEDAISGYFHARRSGTQNQSSRVTSPSMSVICLCSLKSLAVSGEKMIIYLLRYNIFLII